MTDARKMAERALAEADRAVSAWGSNAILVSEKRLSTALGYLAAATRALLASEPASKRGPVADAADARRRAEEYLRLWGHHESEGIEIMRALLAAGPEAVCTPGCACGAPHEPDDEDPCACPCHEPDGTPASSDAAVREAAERLRQLLRPPVTMTPDGCAFFRVEDVETVLRAARLPLAAIRQTPPSDAVREAAERLWHSLTPPRSTTDDGMLLVRAEDVEAVLRALASSHAAPAKDAVREAAEAVVRGDWWGHYCPSCGSTAKHGPECRIGRLAKALSSARAAKGGAE